MYVNEVSVSRLLWGQRTGGPPTRGRRKPLCSLLRPWLVVSQIKKWKKKSSTTTNYDNVIGTVCVKLGLTVLLWGLELTLSSAQDMAFGLNYTRYWACHCSGWLKVDTVVSQTADPIEPFRLGLGDKTIMIYIEKTLSLTMDLKHHW